MIMQMKLLMNFSSHFFQDTKLVLEASTRGSELIFALVQLLYYKCQKINFKCGGLYIDSPDCIRKKKATINPRNRVDKLFQFAVTVALNYGKLSGIQKEFQILNHL